MSVDRLVHWIVGALACVAIPAASWIEGSRGLAWSMYTSSETYRLQIVAHGVDGRARWVAPTELSLHATRHASIFLSGADHFRHAPGARTMQGHLDSLAMLACGVAEPRAASIDVTLERRVTLDAPVVATRTTVTCPR